MRSNIVRTASGASVIGSPLSPPRHERVLEPDVVENARDDEVDEIVDGPGAVVEAGREEEDRPTGAAQREHVLEVNRRQRRLPWADDELTLFLQRNRGR